MNIKPIETRYKGYRFRSRLEARWAVFFDTLGIPWEYEKEGLLLDQTPYLPDFWLPVQHAHIEIKPSSFGEDREAYIATVITLAKLATGTPGYHPFENTVILCAGNPFPGEYSLSCAIKGQMDIAGGVWAIDRRDDKSLWVHDPDTGASIQLNSASTDHDRPPMDVCSQLTRAYTAARSARFEHGEAPR